MPAQPELFEDEAQAELFGEDAPTPVYRADPSGCPGTQCAPGPGSSGPVTPSRHGSTASSGAGWGRPQSLRQDDRQSSGARRCPRGNQSAWCDASPCAQIIPRPEPDRDAFQPDEGLCAQGGRAHDSSPAPPHRLLCPAFRQGLAKAGYVKGRNTAIEYRWANMQSQHQPALAMDLVQQGVALIVTIGNTKGALAAKSPSGDFIKDCTAFVT
jgi:hypothetical protein